MSAQKSPPLAGRLSSLLVVALMFVSGMAMAQLPGGWGGGSQNSRSYEFDGGGWNDLTESLRRHTRGQLQIRAHASATEFVPPTNSNALRPQDLLIRANNVSVDDLMQAIAGATGTRLQIDGRTYTFTREAGGDPERRDYPIRRSLLADIGALSNTSTVNGTLVASFFTNFGILLSGGDAIQLANDGREMSVRTDAENHRRIARLLWDLDAIRIEAEPSRGTAFLDLWVLAADTPRDYYSISDMIATQSDSRQLNQRLQSDNTLEALRHERLSIRSGEQVQTDRREEVGRHGRLSLRSNVSIDDFSVIESDRQNAPNVGRLEIDWRGDVIVAAESRRGPRGPRTPGQVIHFDLDTTVDLVPGKPVILSAGSLPAGDPNRPEAAPGVFLVAILHGLQVDERRERRMPHYYQGSGPTYLRENVDGDRTGADQNNLAAGERGGIRAPGRYEPADVPSSPADRWLGTLPRMLDRLQVQMASGREPYQGYIYLGKPSHFGRRYVGGGSNGRVDSVREGFQLHALRTIDRRTLLLMDPVVNAAGDMYIKLPDIDGETEERAEDMPGVYVMPMPRLGSIIISGVASTIDELGIRAPDQPSGPSRPADVRTGNQRYTLAFTRVRDRRMLAMLDGDGRRSGWAVQRLASGLKNADNDIDLLGLQAFEVSVGATRAPVFSMLILPFRDAANGSGQARRLIMTAAADGDADVTLSYQLEDRRIGLAQDGAIQAPSPTIAAAGAQPISRGQGELRTDRFPLDVIDYRQRGDSSLKVLLQASGEGVAEPGDGRPGGGYWGRDRRDQRDQRDRRDEQPGANY